MKKKILIHIITGFIGDTLLKKYILILSLGFICFSAMSKPHMASKQQMQMFINSTTCVVLIDSSNDYNVCIRDAIEKYWKSTEFQFIDQKEFEKRRVDTKYSFLVLIKGAFDDNQGTAGYNYLSLVMGNAANDITKMPEICSIPISYSDNNCIDYGYGIPSIIKFIQKHAKNLEKKNRFLIAVEGLNYYNFSAVFKDKALLLNKDMMAPDANSVLKIKNNYPYNFKLLKTSDIEAELAANPENTIFNLHVGPNQGVADGKCLEMIFDVEGNLYYYNYHKKSEDYKDGFNRKDLLNILKI